MQPHKQIYIGLVVLLLCGIFAACTTVPLTGRKTLNLLPASQMNAMALTQYQSFLQQNPPSNNSRNGQLVQEIGVNIQRATEKYYSENQMADKLKGFDWNFNLVQDNTVNAWCMPGGRVVIYSGSYPLLKILMALP
jgi:predicted Zn-dependent protease